MGTSSRRGFIPSVIELAVRSAVAPVRGVRDYLSGPRMGLISTQYAIGPTVINYRLRASEEGVAVRVATAISERLVSRTSKRVN